MLPIHPEPSVHLLRTCISLVDIQPNAAHRRVSRFTYVRVQTGVNTAAAKLRIAPSYVRRLLAAVNKTEDSTPATQGLIEPLSERELEVLRLLGTDLGGPEIARELVVSLNTVRTHTKNIYAKLGVNNRRAAVRRARELDLSRTGNR